MFVYIVILNDHSLKNYLKSDKAKFQQSLCILSMYVFIYIQKKYQYIYI